MPPSEHIQGEPILGIVRWCQSCKRLFPLRDYVGGNQGVQLEGVYTPVLFQEVQHGQCSQAWLCCGVQDCNTPLACVEHVDTL